MPRPFAWVRLALLVLFLLFGALGSPLPWAALWLVLPAVVAAGLLTSWRYGNTAFVLPALLLAVAVGTQVAFGWPVWFTLWTPLAAAVGCWMGVREEGGGPGIGERAWMLVPLLAMAAVLPLAPGFPAAMGRLDSRIVAEQELIMKSAPPGGVPAAWLDAQKQFQATPAEERTKFWIAMVPNLLFLWAVLLVSAGRAMAARIASALQWPPLSRSPVHLWKLPDAALVPLIASIALLVFAGPALQPSAVTLLVFSVLGYSVQGVAVVESVLLSRGMPPVFVALTVLFVIAVSLLWILPAVAVVGLSDVWLDYRKLEPAPAGEA
ncbi:MAG: DUF2232 domain-containing protein [Candidatus Eisenbacteria bacterium]|nr:DUF2232 domain-containing protein [Candidatus Eisenbacteria bacterium]